MSQYREKVTKRFEQSTRNFFIGFKEWIKDVDVSAYSGASKYLTGNRVRGFREVAIRLYCAKVDKVVAYVEPVDKELTLIVEIQGWTDEEKKQTIGVYLIFDLWGQCLAGADVLIEDHKECGYVGARDNGANELFKQRIDHYISLHKGNRQVEIVDEPYIYSTRPVKEIGTIKANIPLEKLKNKYPKCYATLRALKKIYEDAGHSILDFQKLQPNMFSPLRSIKRNYVQSGKFNPIVWYGLVNDDFYCIVKEGGLDNCFNYTLYKKMERIVWVDVAEERETLTVRHFDRLSPFYLNQFLFDQIKQDGKEHGFNRIEIVLPVFSAALIYRFKDKFSSRVITPDFLSFGLSV